jgi:multidrug transporter EmrE-like cation transporter
MSAGRRAELDCVWLRLMLVAFLANGIGPFGLRVLQGEGMLEPYRYPYLFYWYAGGAALAAAFSLRGWSRPRAAEWLLGGAMGACSLGGQVATALALEAVPGHAVFAVTTGGTLFIVAAAGILVFKERVGRYGLAGIALGIASILMLGLA